MSTPEINLFIENIELDMNNVVDDFRHFISKYRTGRPHPDLVAHIKVECYGSTMSIQQIANINIPDGHEIVIKPYDPKQISAIVKALHNSNLNLPVNNETNLVRLKIPPLTEDIRKKISREVQSEVEQFKVRIRNFRREALHRIKQDVTSEGERMGFEEDIQKLTNSYTKKIQLIADEKIKELMTL